MKEISAALVRAQKEFGPALKTSTNPHFRNRYAALDACIEAVIDALNTNGIMLMQQTHPCEDGVIVETIFIHESGEQISGGKLHVPASKHDAQGYGSALTYARRYSLQAACGIAPEDDDGQAASKPRAEAPKPAAKPAAPAKAPAAPKVIEGKGPWSLTVSMTPEGSFEDWVALVQDVTQLALENVSSEADVMAIFRNNKNIFDKVKESASAYEEILAMFTKAKNQFKKEEE
jgi:ERF superfamily